uniref:RBR-type E3 ubiquitin transferase n=1 Tax=Arundo donax TaxID=35708 RepID=A0A0A9CSL9_ARUDO
MNLLNIKQHQARALLIHHRWRMDCICDCFDRKGRDRMLRDAGIVLQKNNSLAVGGSTMTMSVTCNVCFEDFSLTFICTMDCGHSFCNNCWTEHFYASVKSGKKQARCMEVKCSAICDEGIVRRLLGWKYPDSAKRFDHFLLESYLEDNDSVKWCPSAPHCGRAIRVSTGERYCEVECLCGFSFCFNCAAHAHSPCPCTIWEKWNFKSHGESENIKWILNNTKSCPKCFKPIEKDGGCNLVRCKCGQYMCWLCGGPTGSEHTWSSIAGHSCNRYKEEEGGKRADASRKQLQRYTHYCDRFKIHGNSYTVEKEKLGAAIEERARQLESDLARPLALRDGDWLTRAHRRLLVSRQVLSRSYAFAYYMFGGEVPTRPQERASLAVARNLFEDQQERLERHVEHLSKVLAADVPALPEAEIVRAKQEAATLVKTVETLCGELYKCIQDELLALLVEPMSIAAYRPDGPDKAKELAA